jgi:hypothetical protein
MKNDIIHTQKILERINQSFSELTDDAFWQRLQIDVEQDLKIMTGNAHTFQTMIGVILTEYKTEQLKSKKAKYTDGKDGTIHWNDFKENPPELAGEYLAIFKDGPVIKIFKDAQGEYCEYPAMDDIDVSRITHWAEINLPQ